MPDLKQKTPHFGALSLVRTAAPIVTFYLTEILVGLTDLAVVGTLGTAPLAAVGLAKSILLSIMVIGFAVLSVGTVFMAENPKPHRCGKVVAGSLILTVFFAALAVAIGNGSGSVLAASGYDADTVALFDDYAGVLAWAVGPALIFASLKNVLNATNRTAIISLLSIGMVFGNLAGSLLLVHGTGAWPGLGVAGAAWATLVINMIAATGLIVFTVHQELVSCRRVSTLEAVATVKEMWSLGWAAGAQQALESVLFIAVLYLLGLHSPVWLAAGAVVFAIMELNYAVSSALGEVLSARMAALRAAQKAVELLQILRLGTVVSGAAAVLLAIVVNLFADVTVSLFSGPDTSAQARRLMIVLLLWTAPVFLFDAWQIVFVHALRGLRRTVLPMLLSAACYWGIGIGGGLYLSMVAQLGASGVWIGFCAGLVAAAALVAAMAFSAASRIGNQSTG
jgi:MATE family multidrug resistance protein